MTRKNSLSIHNLFLTLLLVLFGCGRTPEKPAFVARVNNRDITETDLFNNISQADFYTKDPDARSLDIENLALNLALLMESEEAGFASHPQVLQAVAAYYFQQYLNEFVDKAVWEPILGDSALRETYLKLNKKVGMSHILLKHKGARGSSSIRSVEDTRALAYSLWNRIKSGELKFSNTARRYSEDPVMRHEKGDHGYVLWGGMVPEVLAVAWDPMVQTFPEPIRSDFGYHLLWIKGSQRVIQPPFEDARKEVIRLVRSRKTPEYDIQLRQAERELDKKHSVALYEERINTLYEWGRELSEKKDQRISFSVFRLFPGREPLAAIGNKELTLDWFMAQAAFEPRILNSPIVYYYDLKKLMEDLVHRYLGVEEAKKQDLLDRATLRPQAEKVRKKTMLDQYVISKLEEDPLLTETILRNRTQMKYAITINPYYLTYSPDKRDDPR